jgi:hypothetical protein
MRKREASNRGQKKIAADMKDNQRVSDRLRKQLLVAKAQFVATEIDLGVTFCSVAQSSTNSERKQRNMENARKARDSASHFLKTPGLSDTVRKELGEKLAVLETTLAGGNNAGAPSSFSRRNTGATSVARKGA